MLLRCPQGSSQGLWALQTDLNASKVCITAIYFATRFPRGVCVLQLMDRGTRGMFRTGQQSYITNF